MHVTILSVMPGLAISTGDARHYQPRGNGLRTSGLSWLQHAIVAAFAKGSSRFVTVTRLLQIPGKMALQENSVALHGRCGFTVHSQIYVSFMQPVYAGSEAEGTI